MNEKRSLLDGGWTQIWILFFWNSLSPKYYLNIDLIMSFILENEIIPIFLISVTLNIHMYVCTYIYTHMYINIFFSCFIILLSIHLVNLIFHCSPTFYKISLPTVQRKYLTTPSPALFFSLIFFNFLFNYFNAV